MFEGMTDFFADGGASRFAQRSYGSAMRAKVFREQRDLRGLAAPFGTLKGNQKPAHSNTLEAGSFGRVLYHPTLAFQFIAHSIRAFEILGFPRGFASLEQGGDFGGGGCLSA